jgi:UDP-N-acetylmuramate: L-alanyl-gamma-D-glutamyl-meso-diaminopimelate ligase
MHIHVLGICGTFMGGLAAIAREAGFRVTGCDANVYPPMSDQLRALGIELIEGWDPAQLALRPDVWVVGNVVSRGNPLIEAILDDGQAYVSGPQWLAEHVLRGRWVMAVAGTHGKTTTASMLAWILQATGREPGYLIGGLPRNFPFSARRGASPLFVIEADEYDTAFFDKRSKFVHYRPRTAILNNLEYDHADIFPDLAAIETQFHHLVRTVPRSGRLVVNGADEALERVLARGLWSECARFGVPEGWHLGAVHEDAQASRFEVFEGGVRQGECRLALPGEHSRSNALAAIAAAAHAGVAPAAAIEALAAFEGVRRRLELRGTEAGVAVYDDFAHHPTAIETTVAGLRARLAPGQRLLAVLEPRSNTMKLGAMAARLAPSLAGADRVFCHSGGVGWDVAAALAPLGDRATVLDAIEPLVAAIVAQTRPGDAVLVMSNGGFGGIHERLLRALQAGPSARQAEDRTAPSVTADGPTAPRVIYLHGFRSSPQSFKARLLGERMRALGRLDQWHCPALPPSPRAAVEGVLATWAPGPADTLIGSSLGGFYATWLAERTGCRAVLLNPAVRPAGGLAAYVGEQPLYHGGGTFVFERGFLDELRAMETAITRPQRYFLVAATGDELLDWRDMVAHYPGARHRVIQGSDHGISDFAEYQDEVLAFAGIDTRTGA